MKRNKFSLSHYRLFSMSQGWLIPCGMYEVLPGDTVQHSTSALVRVSPLVAPVMHPVHARIHHWFVPYRLLWDDWESFITGGPDGMDASVFPTRTFTDPGVGTLADYLGVPPGTYSAEVSALPFRAYAKVFNEWYRDQDLVAPVALSTASGPDVITNVSNLRVAWEKDYFTSARPWEQKGPAVSIPIGVEAQVVPNVRGAPEFLTNTSAADFALRLEDTTDHIISGGAQVGSGSSDSLNWKPGLDVGGDAYTGLMADLTTATAVNINDLREAFALQRYEEARARYGSRYSEYLRYLGVRSSDARLQRPEYLGGGKQTIQFSEVLQTAEGTSPVGEMRGHGLAGMRSNRFRRFFEEHGLVLSLMSVKPRTVYPTMTHRHWLRRSKEDFWQKELEHIGQQEITNREIYPSNVSPDGVFGYQDRYDEYRRMESGVAGEFRTTLNYWHMAREFSAAPTLNSSFVQANPTDRVYASTGTDELYVMSRHSIQARRMLTQTGASFIY